MKLATLQFLSLIIFLFLSTMSLVSQESLQNNIADTVIIDFNFDGIEDNVVGLYTDSTYKILLISLKTNGIKDTTEISFELNNGTSFNAFCGSKITLEKEKLNYNLSEILGAETPGYNQSEKNYGIKLSDGLCDSFHLYWDTKSQMIKYWRL